MSPQPRRHLAALEPAVHGGPNYSEFERLGVSPNDVLDFSANTNPGEPPGELRGLLASVPIGRYPDPECLEIRRAAARRYGLAPDQVLAANGSVELIRLLCAGYLEPGEAALFGQPTFGEYEVSTRLQGAEPLVYPLFPSAPSGPALSRLIQDTKPKLFFLCNPNNPTGHFMPASEALALAEANPYTLVVVDEAYIDFVPGGESAIRSRMPENLVVLRSMTKFPALAGLRLGLLFGSPTVVALISKIQPPWNVNAMAQAAGVYILRHTNASPNLEMLAESKGLLHRGLSALGLHPLPSSCNFFLVDVSSLRLELQEGEAKAAAVRRALLVRRCLVRDCSSFGLPEHVRISVRTPDECQALVEAFQAIMASRTSADNEN